MKKTTLYEEGLGLIKDTKYYEIAAESMPGDTEADILDEALTLMVGETSVDLMKNKLDGDLLNQVLDWLQRFWSEIKRLIGMASAEDIARIAAMEMVYRRTPSLEKGVVIDGKKYQRITHPQKNNIRRMRNAGILAGIHASQKLNHADRTNVRFLQSLFDQILRREFEKGNPNADADEVVNYMKNNASKAKPYRDNMKRIAGRFIQENIVKGREPTDREIIEQHELSQEAEVAAWDEIYINYGGENIPVDANVRAVLDNFIDERGNPLNADAFYGICTLVGKGANTAKEFMKNLKNFGEVGNGDLDAAYARQLHSILEGLPNNIKNPVLEQLRNLVTVDYVSVHMTDKGLRVYRSNQKFKSKEIANIILDSIKTRIRISKGGRIYTSKSRKDALKDLRVKLAFAQEAFKEGVGYDTMVGKYIHEIQDSLGKLTGVPFDLDWFITKGSTDVSEKSLGKEKTAAIDKNKLDAIKQFLSFTDVFTNQSQKDQDKWYDAMRDKLMPVARNLRESQRDAAVFRNIMGNQQRAYRIGGFAHRFFNDFAKSEWVKKFQNNSMFQNAKGQLTKLGEDVAQMYTQSFRYSLKQKRNIVAHTDGMLNMVKGIGKKKQHDRMHIDDELIYSMALFTGQLKTRVSKNKLELIVPPEYYQSPGTLGSREFKALVSTPTIQSITIAKEIVKSFNEDGKYNENLKEAGLIPNEKALEADIDWIMKEQLPNMPKEVKEQLFGEDIGKLAEESPSTFEALAREAVSLYVYNDAIHRVHLGQMLVGDFNNFSKPMDIVKRMAGTTTPIQRIDKPIKVVVIKDLYLDNLTGEITEEKNDADGVENKVKASDGQSFANDVLATNIQDSGGALIEYGNGFKPVVNHTSADGEFTYIKTSTLSFKGRNDISSQDEVKEKIRKYLKKHVKDNVLVVFESAIKSKKTREINVYSVEQLENETIEFAHDLPAGAFGVQFNINEDIGHKDATSTLSTQLLKIAAASPEKALKLEKALVNLSDELLKGVNNYLLGNNQEVDKLPETTEEERKHKKEEYKRVLREAKETVLRDAAAVSKHGGEGTGNAILNFLLENTDMLEDGGKLDHADIFNKIQNYISSTFSKAMKYRLSGGHALQSTVYDNSLKWMSKNEKTGKINPAEVKVPLGFVTGSVEGDLKLQEEGKLAETQIILSRIPNSDFMTNIIAVPVGFTEEGNNVLEVHPAYIEYSNSDLDGDGLYMIKREKKKIELSKEGKKKKKEDEKVLKMQEALGFSKATTPDSTGSTALSSAKDKVFDVLWELMEDGDMWERYQQKLSVDPLKKDIDDTTKEQGYAVNQHPISSIRGSLGLNESLKESNSLIGAFAVGSKLMDVLSLHNATLSPQHAVYLPGADTEKKIQRRGRNLSNNQKEANAMFLQLALDDTAELKMGETGITLDNANVANTLLMLDYTQIEVMNFMKHPSIVHITESLRKRRILNDNKKPAGELDIIENIIKEVRSREEKERQRRQEQGSNVPYVWVINGVSVLDVVQTYKKAHIASQQLRNSSKLIKLDKGAPKNIISLLDTLNTVEKLKKQKIIDLGTYLESPLLNKHLDMLNDLKNIYAEYFSFSVDTKEDIQEFQNLLTSFTNTMTIREREYIMFKTHTEIVAQQMATIKFDSQDKVNTWLNDTAFELASIKESINFQKGDNVSRWFALISYNDGSKRIEPSLELGIPELSGVVDPDVSRKFIEEEFAKIPESVREAIINYAIFQSGLSGGKYSITKLLPDSVLENFFKKLKTAEINEAFYDEIAKTGIERVQNLNESSLGVIRDSGIGDKTILFKKKAPPNKYFTRSYDKVVKGKVVKGEIKLFKMDSDNKKAELIHSVDGDTRTRIDTKEVIAPVNHEISKNDKQVNNPKAFKHGYKITDQVLLLKSAYEKEKLASLFPEINEEEGIDLSKGELLEEVNQPRAVDTDDKGGQLKLDLQKKAEKAEANATSSLRRTLRRLRNKFGINYKIINDPEQKWAGAYNEKTGEVIINEAYAGASTPFHEFSHPFIRAIKKTNPVLYKKLVRELETSEEGKEILKYVQEAYPELKKSAQIEEAMVELLGREAAGTLKEKTLRELVVDLLKQIATYLKSMFGNRANVIPSELDPNTTLGDLADMLTDTRSISTDVDTDTRVKRIMSRGKAKIQNALNKAYTVANYAKMLSPRNKSIRNKMEAAGFLLNDSMIIMEKDSMIDDIFDPVAVRVPVAMKDNWMSEVKKTYPEARVVSKEETGIVSYDRYMVYLGNGDLVSVYKPKGENAGSAMDAFKMNIRFQANALDATDKKRNLKSNPAVMDGISIDQDEHLVSDYDMSKTEDAARKAFFHEVEAAKSNLPIEWTIASLANDETKQLEAINILEENIAAKIIQRVADRIVSLKINGESIAGFVNFNPSKLNKDQKKGMLVAMFMGKIDGLAPELRREYDNFIRAYGVIKHQHETKGQFLYRDSKTNKRYKVGSESIAANVLETIDETSEKRESWLDKHPIFKALWKAMVNMGSMFYFKEYWVGSMVPKVFARVMTGSKGEKRQVAYGKTMHDIIRKLDSTEDGKSVLDSKLNEITRQMGKKDHELKTMKVKLYDSNGKEKTYNIPIARAVGLYMTLRQKDVRQKDVREKYITTDNDGVGRFKINFADIDMGGRDGALLQSGASYEMTEGQLEAFQTAFKQSKDNEKIVAVIDEMFTESKEMLNPVIKTHMGAELESVDNYYPVTLGGRSLVPSKEKYKRLEDLRFFKQRTENKGAELRIEDAFEATEFYIRETSGYYGFAEPVLNLRKFITSFEAELAGRGLDPETDKPMKGKKGREADEYKAVIKYMKDLEEKLQDYSLLSGVSDTEIARGIQWLMNNFQLAVLGMNPSVALKQTVSFTSAAAELGDAIFKPKYLGVASSIIKTSIKDIKLTGDDKRMAKLDLDNKDLQRMLKVSPVMEQRVKGYIDREQGEYRSHGANPYSEGGKKTKIAGHEFDLSKLMEWIKIFDAATVTAIFVRVEDEIHEKYKIASLTEEQMEEKVRDRFEQVVNDTQPTYSILNRTRWGRSKDQFVRILTMFSSQRAKNGNILLSAMKNGNILLSAMHEFMVNPSYASRLKFKTALLAVGIAGSLSIAVIDKIKYMLYGNYDDPDESLAAELASASINTFMGNFYGGGQFHTAVFQDKPWDAVNHPVIQLSNDALQTAKYMKDGEFIRGMNKGAMTFFKATGLPVFPLARAKSIWTPTSTSAARKKEKAKKESKPTKSAENKSSVTSSKKEQNRLKALRSGDPSKPMQSIENWRAFYASEKNPTKDEYYWQSASKYKGEKAAIAERKKHKKAGTYRKAGLYM